MPIVRPSWGKHNRFSLASSIRMTPRAESSGQPHRSTIVGRTPSAYPAIMGRERSLADEDPESPPRTPSSKRRVSRNTREALLDAALEQFSSKGFGGTSIRDLARAVGIRESSVYKHFASKQALLDALIERADAHLGSVAARFGTTITAGADAASTYQGVSEESLLAIARGMLDVVLHDPQFALLRRLLTVEQYREPDTAARYRDYFITRPLSFQTDLFRSLIAIGDFREGLDPEQVALAFFGPIHLLIALAERDEQRADELLSGHIRHFRRTHLKEA